MKEVFFLYISWTLKLPTAIFRKEAAALTRLRLRAKITVKHGHDCLGNALEVVPDALLSRETNLSSALVSLVGKIDGNRHHRRLYHIPTCKAATDRAKYNEPKRGRLFRNAIIRHLEEIIAATARRIQVVVPSDKSTPVTHPVPFITNETLAACVHGRSSKEWEVAFCHVVSFVFPQPPYLGPSKMKHFDTLSFDEDVIVPPMTKFSSETTNSTTSEAKITEISSDSTADDYGKRSNTSDVWYVVLFHVEWSRKSRELEMTLARMSNQLAPSTLSFGVVTPESTPPIFYDLDLSTSVTSSFQDLPLIALYHRGELVDRLPKNAQKIALERKERREEMRRQGWSSKSLREGQRRRERKKITEGADAGDGDEGSESGSGTDESEDEREVQIIAAV
ncbi:BQ5605_C005g03670 [Microbotryum silenes-dioicae]|uniref:BQ5605_C005g03670 protein n=1 Tax=Microbotryum silenes-dioicae TaxID=796604 RepID=A0A2X0MFY7_9BASI|nr:BQ5605_C005g03670 [Microbotryum silenes-dioicae]